MKAACEAFGVARSTHYRRRKTPSSTASARPRRARSRSPRALKPAEQRHVLEVLRAEEYVDKAPETVFAELLDQGTYLCSARTMYRLLSANNEVRERRDQRRHPTYARPELLATAPRQVWSWDISFLRGPKRGCYYHLYVVMDIFSRYVVGWTLQPFESGEVACELIKNACKRENITSDIADNGAAMTSTALLNLFHELGITSSFIRPSVSNDNCYSEALFRTCKYRPSYPDRFRDFDDALAWCKMFFSWYNQEHRHSGIAYLTPAWVHFGKDDDVTARRAVTLAEAYAKHPERFVARPPRPPVLPTAVYINPPLPTGDNAQIQ